MVLYSIKLRSEQAPRDGESGHDDGHHRHELDEDVQARTGSVLERVAHGVAHHGGTVYLAALPAEITFFDIFLGIVPGTTGVGHEANTKPADKPPTKRPMTPGTPNTSPVTMGATMASSEGKTISRCAPLVEICTQRA